MASWQIRGVIIDKSQYNRYRPIEIDAQKFSYRPRPHFHCEDRIML
jgi:hypothetical protein